MFAMEEKREVHTSVTEIPSETNHVEPTSNPCLQHEPHKKQLFSFGRIIDILVVLSPILFVGLAVAGIAYNHKPVEGQQERTINFIPGYSYTATGGQSVIDAANVAVSIFPILFAAVVGRFMKAYAMHRAERGSRVGILEQLHGSQSLSNAVQLSFALRGPGFFGFTIVLLWLLSPLGGQGVKRVLSVTTRTDTENATVFYTNSSALSENRNSALGLPSLNAILSSALITSNLVDHNDVWGNLKIPRLTSLQSSDQSISDDTWFNNTSNSTSSSLIGYLVNNVPKNASTSFNMTTSYISFSCLDSKQFFYKDDTNMSGYNDFLTWVGPLLWTNLTNSTNIAKDSLTEVTHSDWEYLIDVKSNGTAYIPGQDDGGTSKTFATPPTFIVAAQTYTAEANLSDAIDVYECTPSILWVDAEIKCPAGNYCEVMRMRASPNKRHMSEHGIFWQSPQHQFTPLRYLMKFLNALNRIYEYEIETRSQDFSSTLALYLAGANPYPDSDSSSSSDNTANSKYANYTGVTGADIGPRLSIIINSAWLTLVQSTSTAAGQSTNVTVLSQSDPNSSGYHYATEHLGYDVVSAQAQLSADVTIYTANWAWIIISLLISCLLLVLGFLGLYYRYTNKSPDILGFVSTLTRQNSEFDSPQEAEKFDGLEMARYFKHTKVQLVSMAEGGEQSGSVLRRYQSRGD